MCDTGVAHRSPGKWPLGAILCHLHHLPYRAGGVVAADQAGRGWTLQLLSKAQLDQPRIGAAEFHPPSFSERTTASPLEVGIHKVKPGEVMLLESLFLCVLKHLLGLFVRCLWRYLMVSGFI